MMNSSPSTNASAQSGDLSDNVYQILRNAVNLARNESIQSVKALRARLLEIHPGMEVDIQQALSTWSGYLQRRGVGDYRQGR